MSRPGMSQRLGTSMAQQQSMLPRMLQSIEVLQLPSLELEAWLRDQAEQNEALEMVEPALPAGRGSREATDAHDEMLRNQPDRGPTAAEQVMADLGLIEGPVDLLELTRFLAGCLDDRGLLVGSDAELLELARDCGVAADPERLARAVQLLQSLEPRGIGARSPVEALLLQLDPTDTDFEPLRRLLVDFLDELSRNKLPAVARALGVGQAELARLLGRLGELELRPAAGLLEHSAPTIVPEVLVERSGDGFEIKVDHSGLPGVRIDPEVSRLATENAANREVRSYLRGKLERARWLVEALEQRRRTLLRVAVQVFERQRAFLESGPHELQPLRMGELADALDLHLSTISRAVGGKYAQTPWGIFPLRHFFQAAAEGDSDMARSGALDVVRELFASEDPTAPLSDDDVVRSLAQRGLKVARRTVAKYRGELGIPSSYRRRRYES